MDRSKLVGKLGGAIALNLILQSGGSAAVTLPKPFYTEIEQAEHSVQIDKALSASRETRIAVVVGADEYPGRDQLSNAINDAKLVGTAFYDAGFDVKYVLDPSTPAEIFAPLRALADSGVTVDVVALYFAGHGVEYRGENFLIPIAAELDFANRLRTEAASLPELLLEMNNTGARMRLIFLDACRDNNFRLRDPKGQTRSLSVSDGLGFVRAGDGLFISYATTPGDTASDGPEGKNSPYAYALNRHLATPVFLNNIKDHVVDDVLVATGGTQTPWMEGRLPQELLLRPVITSVDKQYIIVSSVLLLWEALKDAAVWEVYLSQDWEEPIFAEQAKMLLAADGTPRGPGSGKDEGVPSAEKGQEKSSVIYGDVVISLSRAAGGTTVRSSSFPGELVSALEDIHRRYRVDFQLDAERGVSETQKRLLSVLAEARKPGERGTLVFQTAMPAQAVSSVHQEPTAEEAMAFARALDHYRSVIMGTPELRDADTTIEVLAVPSIEFTPRDVLVYSFQ